MNKIIIVGHPHSGHEEVQRLLTECGMAPALPSRRENLTPAQITQTLVQAHGATSLELLQSADQLQQIKVAPVWQGMVLDLVLANLAQPLWGWADTEAVYLLDYWKEQDPQVVFVLVYDAPETVLTRVPLGQAAAPQEELQRRIDAWVAYNSALLHFHLRSAGRSVLVHAGQVQASVKSSLHHITAHINAPLQLPPRLLITSTVESQAPQNLQAHAEIVEELTAKLNTMQGKQFKKARQRLRAELQALQSAASAATEGVLAALHSSVAAPASDLPLCPAPNVFEQGHLDADALANLLAQQLLQTHPKSRQLYEELQAGRPVIVHLKNTAVSGVSKHTNRVTSYEYHLSGSGWKEVNYPHIATSSTYGHWVCVVGISPTADPENLRESDFYALDPARVSVNGTLAVTKLLDGTIWTDNSPLKVAA